MEVLDCLFGRLLTTLINNDIFVNSIRWKYILSTIKGSNFFLEIHLLKKKIINDLLF